MNKNITRRLHSSSFWGGYLIEFKIEAPDKEILWSLWVRLRAFMSSLHHDLLQTQWPGGPNQIMKVVSTSVGMNVFQTFSSCYLATLVEALVSKPRDPPTPWFLVGNEGMDPHDSPLRSPIVVPMTHSPISYRFCWGCLALLQAECGLTGLDRVEGLGSKPHNPMNLCRVWGFRST